MKKLLFVVLFFGNISLAQNLVANLLVIEQNARALNNLKYNVDGIDGHQYLLDD